MDRETRILKHVKGYAPKLVRRKPSPSEGNNGDIVIGNTTSGIKLFAKIENRWYSFSSDSSVDTDSDSNVINIKATSSGTVSSPTKTLKPSDAGKVYVVDISDYRALIKLPPVALSTGAYFKFIIAEDADNENVNDFIVISHATGEDIMGVFHTSGTVSRLSVDRSIAQFNASDAVIYAGDWMEFTCNGKEWYGRGVSFNANFEGADDFTIQ